MEAQPGLAYLVEQPILYIQFISLVLIPVMP
jgi:hypothetical protein